MTTLLAVPNVSEGRDTQAIDAIAQAFDAKLLDVHSDPDHNRSVFTLAGPPGVLAHALAAGAQQTIARIDINRHDGVHPRVGALDVAPIVYLSEADRGAACAEALLLADLLGHERGLPVFLYGELADGRTRADLRRGGPDELASRIAANELVPDFGPKTMHPTAGATLVAARPPLIAFNVELASPATHEDAERIAATIRETAKSGDGLKGVRAIGLWLERSNQAQISTNIEDFVNTPPATVIAAIRKHARIQTAELVGLAPRAAFDGFPDDVEVLNKRLIEEVLA